MLASVTHSERVCDLQAFLFFLVGDAFFHLKIRKFERYFKTFT